MIKNSIATQEPYVIEHEIIKKDASRAFAQGAGSVQFDSHGTPLSISGTVFDITKTKKTIIDFKESEEKFRKITEVSLMGIFLYKEYYLYVNDAFCEMAGYTNEEMLKKHPWDNVDKKIQNLLKERVTQRLQGQEFPQHYQDLNFRRKDGEVRIVRVFTQTIFYQGSYAGLGTVMDITDMHKDKEQLKLLAQAVEQTDEMIRITDKQGINIFVNDSVVHHSGYTQEELLGENNRLFKSNKHPKSFYKNLWATILSKKTYKNTLINRKKDGTLYYENITITPILNEKSEIINFVATSQDISSKIAIENELKRLANNDNLTGLYNRHNADRELEKKIANFKRYREDFVLIMMDIDYFKNVNDTYGHDIGDYVLKELSNIIADEIRELDHFSRWGGEEFMLILPHIQKEQAITVAEKLCLVVSEHPFETISGLTISMGLSAFKQNDTKESILKRIDEALYKAKNGGRNRAVWLD